MGPVHVALLTHHEFQLPGAAHQGAKALVPRFHEIVGARVAVQTLSEQFGENVQQDADHHGPYEI
jgi:hypothetical protein